jgi:Flp pilus assembly protein TadG
MHGTTGRKRHRRHGTTAGPARAMASGHTAARVPERERGASAVEFALVAPILILLVFGIFQFSIVYNRQQGLHAAAREGARIASLPQTTSSEINDRVMAALDGIQFDTPPSITITPASGQPCNQRAGQTVKVVVEATTSVDIPLWGQQGVTLTGRGEFRCE